MVFRNRPGIHSRSRRKRLAQVIRLWISPLFESFAPARVGLASQQELLKSIGTPEGVCPFKYLQYRFRAKLQSAVAMRMEFRDEQGEVTTRSRYAQPFGQVANKCQTARLVTGMAG